ncbi:hypothetical protein [Anaerocolumna jejuensis]|uniref:hypothetical protein n=1 Tax=Anaerocolumna jejuensis TaxID=259063 RepID=UPI003F7B5267
MHIFKESKKEYRSLGRLVIGIAGTHKGVGVTHLGLMLTSCISEGIGLSTAFLHWPDSRDICLLRNHFFSADEGISGIKNISGKEGIFRSEHLFNSEQREEFTVSKASFYPGVGKESMAEILAQGYDCIVMDFGNAFKEHREEFLRCDKKIVVGSLTPWKRYCLEDFIAESEMITGSSDWIYVINFAAEREVAVAARSLNRRFLPVPYERDPFFLSPGAMNFTKNII